MATPIPHAMTGTTRAKMHQMKQHGQYLRAHSRDAAENSAACAVIRLATELEAQLGDVADAIDWKLHSVAYDAIDSRIDPRDLPCRVDGGQQRRAATR